MKKRMLLFATCSLLLAIVHAQNSVTLKSQSNVSFIGHTIQLFRTGSGYGYNISYQNHVLVHQQSNPFTGGANGLKTEDEALKLAKWQIVHFKHYGMSLTPEEKTIPKNVAKELNINTN